MEISFSLLARPIRLAVQEADNAWEWYFKLTHYRSAEYFASRTRRAQSAMDSCGQLADVAAQGEAQACPDTGGQRGIADGADMLLAEIVFELHVIAQPGCDWDGGSEVELRIAVVEIAIGKKQRV